MCAARGLHCHVSVGGLDSITLLLFLRSIGIHIPGISVSHIEDASIQKIHKELGIESLQPLKKEDGTYWNKTVRHSIITGETGAFGGYRKNSRVRLSKKWLEKFGGYENETEGTGYGMPDFKVSAKCCYYLKEKPCDNWAKKHNSVPNLRWTGAHTA